jgi:holo-[acyl-carrier protein] synthase
MKALGIGVDLVEVARIQQSMARQGERFLRRVFTENEVGYCAAMKSPAPNYAVRFAAKEAVAKAFGTGLGAELGLLDIEVLRKDSGEPYIVLHGEGAKLAERRGVHQILLSLSHTTRYAVAQVVITGNAP